MKNYYGIKNINAQPMNRADYNELRGWELPEDENGSDEGYLVEYPDSDSNTTHFDGYISWSPKEVFESAYQPNDRMSFSCALQALKQGHKVARSGWNGKAMFIFLVKGSTFEVNRPPLLGIYPEGTKVDYHAHIDMKTADNMIVPWLCSQTDMLANDWCIHV